MDTRIDPIAGGIYRISTFNSDFRITFNQFLIDAYAEALRTQEFAFHGRLLGRDLPS